MSKLLITGGAGFIGSNYLNIMVKRYKNDFFVCLDSLTYAGNLENIREIIGLSNFKFIQGDIRDKKLVQKLFEDYHFNDIINFDLSTFGENASKHFQVCVNLINKTKLEIEKDILTEKLKTEIDNVKRNEIVSEIQKIMVMINKIKSK